MKKLQFSAVNRKKFVQKIQTEEQDLLIIGGGITGAGIALDAITRGLKVSLIEKEDFAFGTSSRSTKLVHGGLRYLKQLEVGLVHETGTERAVAHKNAPHIVIPEKMLLPIIKDGTLGKYSTSLALKVYDLLARVDWNEHRKMLDKEQTIMQEPLLDTKKLEGGGLYFEYRTDDARLTIETIKTAFEKGAICLNYTQCVDFEYDKKRIIGANVYDSIREKTYTIKAKKIVNASGPWVDELRRKDHKVKGKHLQLTKGVHIVVPYERLPLRQSAYFDVADGRMIFAIPRQGITYIGTTDTFYKKDQDINTPRATKVDVHYILQAANDMFPAAQLKIDDVQSSWAGLRPLIHEEGKDPSELSRKDEIFYAKSGLISIAGGKLTGYRKMAERVVDVVVKQLHKEDGRPKRKCRTKHLTLGGGNFQSTEDIDKFIENKIGEVKEIGLNSKHIVNLVYKYGTHTDKIIDNAYEMYNEDRSIDKDILAVLAEVKYGIQEELVSDLKDFFIRRSGKLYFERPSISPVLQPVATYMAQLLGWDETYKQKQIASFKKEYLAVVNFK